MNNNEPEPSSTGKKNYLQKYFQYAEGLVSSYTGTEPFHIYIKKYFSFNKKHGSRDRKIITSLCYNYFRLGDGVSNDINFGEKLLLSIFLCENRNPSLTVFLKPEWKLAINLPLTERLKIAAEEFKKERIFPFPEELSPEISLQHFNLSFLIQPKLFIRIRPGYEKIVFEKLAKNDFLYKKIDKNCLGFSNNEKVSDVIEIDKEAVIQDYNSQQTVSVFKPFIQSGSSQISIWDCCAGSGGKSILAFDIFQSIKLTVSDTRKKILQNLQLRFTKAGIKDFDLLVLDMQKPVAFNLPFGLVIADVSCSGSGTWARIPEELSFFKKNDIDNYAALQKKIIQNALPHLKSNGYLLYITCSVFKKENEENVHFFQKELKLNLLGMKYLKGYEMQADTLFVALFEKSNS